MRRKWEYMIVPLANGLDEAVLDGMGSDGWELVCITPGTAYFKREKCT